MALATLIGGIGATLTTICFIPQVVKVLRERDTRAISLPMYVLFTIGICFWLTYGLMIESWPIILSNSVTICLSSAILIMKIRLG